MYFYHNHTCPNSSQIPPHFSTHPALCPFKKMVSSTVGVAHILLGVWLCTGAWPSYQKQHLLRKPTLHSLDSYPLLIVSWLGVGLPSTSAVLCEISVWIELAQVFLVCDVPTSMNLQGQVPRCVQKSLVPFSQGCLFYDVTNHIHEDWAIMI